MSQQQDQPFQVNKEDWKLFCKRAPIWKKTCIDKLDQEYIQFLREPGPWEEKLLELRRRVDQDVHRVGVSIELSKPKMESQMGDLLRAGVITLEDLDGFSADLRDRLEAVYRDRRETAEPETGEKARGETA